MDSCPCGSTLLYSECCEPVIKGDRVAETAEQLMRSRYAAYVRHEIDYLLSSLHPAERKDFDPKSTREWAESSEWHGIEIIRTSGGGPDDDEGEVEFIATFTQGGSKRAHHELSKFRKVDDRWYFEKGEGVAPKTVVRAEPKTGRNDPCPCGSGKKFKKCCGI
ncbi:MAG: YchJ family protein [Nitrospirae bacterium]|nr:YchJ family protein [Nitrospirota bacterium]